MGLLSLTLAVGAAVAYEFVDVERYNGSPGDGGYFGYSVKNPSTLTLVGDRYRCARPYVTVLDLDGLWVINHFDSFDIVEDCGALGHVAVQGEDKVAFVYEKEDGSVVIDMQTAWNGGEVLSVPGKEEEMPTQFGVGEAGSAHFVALYRATLELVGVKDYAAEDVSFSVDFGATLGWDDVDSFVLDTEGDFAYVVGNDGASSDRALAKIDTYDGAVVWAAAVGVSEGTPTLLLTQTQVLLCSNSFFARVDLETGATNYLFVESSLWLPGSGTAQVAYDEVNDLIVSVGWVDGVALLRSSSTKTGELVEEVDFTSDLASQDPGSERSDYPDGCEWSSIDDHSTCDSAATSCDGFPGLFCDFGEDDDYSDSGVCCLASGGCCFFDFDDWAANRWNIKGTTEITTVHVADGVVYVVGAYEGNLYDEDAYHMPLVARFQAGDTVAASCTDGVWSKAGDPAKDCAWVGDLAEKRCLVKNDAAEYAFETCLASCGGCGHACADSATWHKIDDPSKDCAWVKRVYNRCAVVGADGDFAFNHCRRACMTCDDEATCAGLD